MVDGGDVLCARASVLGSCAATRMTGICAGRALLLLKYLMEMTARITILKTINGNATKKLIFN